MGRVAPRGRHSGYELSRPWFDRGLRSGLRLTFAWRPDGRSTVVEGLTLHCEARLAAWLDGQDRFDPAACPLAYRRFDTWEQAEAWAREAG